MSAEGTHGAAAGTIAAVAAISFGAWCATTHPCRQPDPRAQRKSQKKEQTEGSGGREQKKGKARPKGSKHASRQAKRGTKAAGKPANRLPAASRAATTARPTGASGAASAKPQRPPEPEPEPEPELVQIGSLIAPSKPAPAPTRGGGAQLTEKTSGPAAQNFVEQDSYFAELHEQRMYSRNGAVGAGATGGESDGAPSPPPL